MFGVKKGGVSVQEVMAGLPHTVTDILSGQHSVLVCVCVCVCSTSDCLLLCSL